MTASTTCAWESDRPPDEAVELLRDASRATWTSIGGSGVRARVLPGRRVRLHCTGRVGAIGSWRLVGRIVPAGSGSRIEGAFRAGVALSLVRRFTGFAPGWRRDTETIARHLEIVCEARPVAADNP